MNTTPSYKQALVARIKDSAQWPCFDRPDFLEELHDTADEAFNSQSFHGYLAAILIYHQLTEEMLKLLIKCSEFFVQLSVAPHEIYSQIPKKAMFGQIVAAFNNTIDMGNKYDVSQLATKINDDRISLVHGLTKQTSLDEIATKVTSSKKSFDEFFDLFESEYDMFRLCFKDFRKDSDLWDEWLDEN